MKRKEETTFSHSREEKDLEDGAIDPRKDGSAEISLSSKSCKNRFNFFTQDLGSMNWAKKATNINIPYCGLSNLS